MTTPQETFLKAMRFETPGRTLATLGGIWPSAIERWHGEGLDAGITDVLQLIDRMGLQRHIWSGPAAAVWVYPAYERRVLGETDDKITYVNHNGIVCTEFKKDNYKSMPHFESFPVTSRADWEAYRHRLAWSDARIGPAWAKQKEQWRRRTEPLIVYMDRAGSLYGSIREMMGVEATSYLFHDDPAMVEEMMESVVALFERLCDALFSDFVPDAVCLWEDMAYKTAPLLGAPMVRRFMLERYKRMTAKLRQKGVPFIVLDSDGYVDELLPIWLEAGIDGVVPMEAQAGMDVWQYRQKHPRMLMLGGVDKKALAVGRDGIDREMEKISRTVQVGGFVPWFDHGLPHDVSYDNFLYYVKRLKEVCGQG